MSSLSSFLDDVDYYPVAESILNDYGIRWLQENVTNSTGAGGSNATIPISSNDGAVLRETFLIYGLLALVLLLLFCIVRLAFPRPYTIRLWVEDFRSPLAVDQVGFISWIWKFHTEDDIMRYSGFDALCFLRLMRMGMKVSVVAIFSSVWLMPVYATSPPSPETDYLTDPLLKINIAFVPSGSRRLIATAIATYTLFGYLMYLILKEFEWFIEKRYRFLSAGSYRPRNYAVFCRNLPNEYRDNAKLADFFKRSLGNPRDVLEAAVCVQTSSGLLPLVNRRYGTIARLEHAIAYHEIKGVRPMHRPLLLSSAAARGGRRGDKVDSIQFYADELAELNQEITERIRAIETKCTPRQGYITEHNSIFSSPSRLVGSRSLKVQEAAAEEAEIQSLLVPEQATTASLTTDTPSSLSPDSNKATTKSRLATEDADKEELLAEEDSATGAAEVKAHSLIQGSYQLVNDEDVGDKLLPSSLNRQDEPPPLLPGLAAAAPEVDETNKDTNLTDPLLLLSTTEPATQKGGEDATAVEENGVVANQELDTSNRNGKGLTASLFDAAGSLAGQATSLAQSTAGTATNLAASTAARLESTAGQAAKLAESTAGTAVKLAESTAGQAVKLATETATSILASKEDGTPHACAFVTFSRLSAVHSTLQMVQHRTPFFMSIEQAPAPDNVIWSNAYRSQRDLQVGFLLSLAATVTLCVFWSIPIAFFASLSSVEGLRSQIPPLDDLLKAQPWLVPVFQLLAPFLVVIVSAMLPTILKAITLLEFQLSRARIESSRFWKLAAFTILQTFFVSALSGGIFEQVTNLASNPTAVVNLLATSLPAQSTYFIQIVFVGTIIPLAVELLRATALAYAIGRRCFGPRLTAKERAKSFFFLRSFADPEDVELARRLYPPVLFIMVLLVYAVISPLTPFVILFCFGAFEVAFRHQFYYVYPEASGGDSGGHMWTQFISVVIFCMFVAEITIFGLLLLKRSVVAVPLMVPLFIVTILFYVYISQQHFRVANFLSAEACIAADAHNVETGELDLNELRGAFWQPELKHKKLYPEDLTREQLSELFGHAALRVYDVMAAPKARPLPDPVVLASWDAFEQARVNQPDVLAPSPSPNYMDIDA